MTAEVLAWIQPVLSTTPDRWLALTGALPNDLLTRPPAPGEWSAHECLQHLVDIEAIFQFRLQCLLDGKNFSAFDPDREGTAPALDQSPHALAEVFAHLRTESLQALAAITPDDLPRQAHHQELGMVTLEQMLHEWAGHDLMHTIQAEHALMQPFIQGCGPWQPYFSDHHVQPDE
jgi:uncharacterized damage-inducible protein DinB